MQNASDMIVTMWAPGASLGIMLDQPGKGFTKIAALSISLDVHRPVYLRP